MDMKDSQRIPAPRAVVWAALNDPEVLKASIPGCESLEMKSPTEMSAKVTLKVGPVKATFGGNVTLSDIDAPNGYRISGEGSGGVAGFAKGGATVKLEEDGPDATILTYAVEAQIGGKLAQLGSRLIDSTAKKLAGEFFERFAAAVAPAPAEEAAGGEAPAVEGEGQPKKGWFGRVFGKGEAAAGAVALVVAGGLAFHACCLTGHGADAETAHLPICGSGPAA